MRFNLNEKPNCICGVMGWETPGKWDKWPETYHRCVSCGRLAVDLGEDLTRVFAITTEKGPHGQIPLPFYEWVINALVPAWREYRKNLGLAREPIVERWKAYASQEFGIAGDTRIDDVPEERRHQWHSFFQCMLEYSAFQKPPGFNYVFVPPQISEAALVHIQVQRSEHGGWEWRKLNREDTLSLPIPPDPIRVQNDELFKGVFDRVNEKLGVQLQIEATPMNIFGPHRSETSYKIVFGEGTVKIKPHHSYWEINIQAPAGMDVSQLRTVAKILKVTFEAKADVVRTLEVHAYETTHLVELLTLIGEGLLGAVV
jgi:hypothetical protein